MRHAIATTLLLLALAACAERGGVSGPYVGGTVGGNAREDARLR